MGVNKTEKLEDKFWALTKEHYSVNNNFTTVKRVVGVKAVK